ncbi:MAG: NAD(P)-binding protein [Actinophytocola sp.]|uniref:FAD-dependent monooxygenase n=1 Tax=Actinophytocola sp. TaxID=1872138 RepID=UPI0013295206|nr:FAD-dependent monooxygenase [Actinophytocola sp.]MPZ85349.1 NAD(P)-binding protein [Actinophytocola sp.]
MSGTEVLVVGAGPTGLALACGLRLHGVSVRVVDKAAGPATTSRANFLHARGSEVLRRLDALGSLPNESLRGLSITGYLGDRQISKVRFGDVAVRTVGPPMLISQARVEAALRDRLAELGAAPDWGVALVGAEQDDSGVTAVLGNGETGAGETVRVGWVIGCDGTGSTARKLAGIGFPGAKITERFLLADVHVDWDLDRSGTSGWIHPTGMLGAMPLPDPDGGPDGGGDLWRLMAYPDQSDEAPTEQQILDRFREILPVRSNHPDARIRDAVWLSRFSVHRRLADSYRHGRILLAGDAAHAHSPVGGQGMLTGLGDAENLAWKLALVLRGRAGEPLLDTYQAERRPLATVVLRGTTAATRNITIRGPVGRFLLFRVVTPIVNLSWVQRRMTYSASQLWVSYRRGPLGAGFGSRLRGKPRIGDRVPDLDCARREGTTGTATRLHDELGGRWALLVPEGAMTTTTDACAAVARDRLGDLVGTLERADGSSEVWLVRPDGHLAWRGRAGPAGSPQRLPQRLRRWLEDTLG